MGQRNYGFSQQVEISSDAESSADWSLLRTNDLRRNLYPQEDTTPMSKPFVSVLTPTYNRRRFIPHLIEMYKRQTYPKDRMEWLILDDGEDAVEDLFLEASKTIPNIRYMRRPPKMLIGKKRNILNQEAKGDILVAMDDDDYYVPERVSHAVTKLMASPKVELAGTSVIFMYYTDIKKIYKLNTYFF